MKMTAALVDLKEGDILEAVSDCATFESDVRKWSERLQKNLLSVSEEPEGIKRVQVQI
jgi:TusA-related sulfurtransferase